MAEKIQKMSDELYSKACKEQGAYRGWLLSLPPEEIIKHCYEYTIRQDIVLALEFVNFEGCEDACQHLLESPAPVALIYKEFNRLDCSWMEDIYDVIEHFHRRIHLGENERSRK